MEPLIPTEVARFVEKHIRSLDQLEVLLLVSALPDREWTVEAVDAIVRSNPNAVSQWLEEFVQSGLLIRSAEPPMYRYAPKSDELARSVAALGSTYKLCRHKVVELIYSRPASSIRSFSDAFRFKKKD